MFFCKLITGNYSPLESLNPMASRFRQRQLCLAVGCESFTFIARSKQDQGRPRATLWSSVLTLKNFSWRRRVFLVGILASSFSPLGPHSRFNERTLGIRARLWSVYGAVTTGLRPYSLRAFRQERVMKYLIPRARSHVPYLPGGPFDRRH